MIQYRLAQPGSSQWPVALFSQHEPAAARETEARKRILLVEDDFIVAGELDYWLRAAGFNVIGPAATAEDALQLAIENKPSVVIMDIRLSGPKDGIEAAVEIYKRLGIRSIFATAHADPRTMERGKAANPFDWVAKPYSSTTLIEKIRSIVASPKT